MQLFNCYKVLQYYSVPQINQSPHSLSLSDGVGQDLPILNAETVITAKELGPTGDLNMFLSNSSTQVCNRHSKKRLKRLNFLYYNKSSLTVMVSHYTGDLFYLHRTYC